MATGSPATWWCSRTASTTAGSTRSPRSRSRALTPAGELDLDHLRGRSGLPTAAQYAEVALRRDLAETRNDSVNFVSRQVEGALTEAVFDVAGSRFAVRVTTRHDPAERLTCSALRDNPIPVHELVDVRRI